MKKLLTLLLLGMLLITVSYAEQRTVNLIVDYKTVYFAGKARQALAINNQIPAPTLSFKEGDHVTINVYNRLKTETALHWHGILVPWQMDGVLGISQRGIQPGSVFHYQFTLHQSGTYWYHAHAGLQEQEGLYGAFVIAPRKILPYHYNQDYVMVLSDWSNTQAEQIYANLKKSGDYYSPRFPLQASLMRFIHDYYHAPLSERKMIWADYTMMQHMRMSVYDISDVAYDAFLLNGQTLTNPWIGMVKVGDVVRLRFIGASAGTIFRVKIPNTTMQLVNVDGNNVKPSSINQFTIAPGETFDVLIKIKRPQPYIIYAESSDKVGAAYGALMTAPNQQVDYKNVTPFPTPEPSMRFMMGQHDMSSMSMTMNHHNMSRQQSDVPMNHQAHNMQAMSMNEHDHMNMSHETSMPSSIPAPQTTGTKYQTLTASVKTNNPDKPIYQTIRMDLNGFMDSFIWFINGVPEYLAKPIILDPAKRYRFVFTNNSMMHHPMHIHGHWFILRNGHGVYDPLLHTIDVAPGAVVTADLDTDASGQWFFHCHLLYHMVAGMARVFQYDTLIEITKHEMAPQHIVAETGYANRPIVRVDEVRPIDVALVKHPMAHPVGFYFSNYIEASADPFDNVQNLTFEGLYGPDFNKLQIFINEAELNKGAVENADVDIFYWRLISQFWAVKGGVNYFYRPALTPYWQPGIGIEGLMPYFIDVDARLYHYEGSTKLDLELSRDTQITNNFFIRLGIRGIGATKTVNRAQIGSGFNQFRYAIHPYYRIMPGWNLFAEYEHQQNYGVFKNQQRAEGESAIENTLSFGVAVLF